MELDRRLYGDEMASVRDQGSSQRSRDQDSLYWQAQSCNHLVWRQRHDPTLALPRKPRLHHGLDEDKASPCHPGLQLLIQWSKSNTKSIHKSIEQMAFGDGSSTIDWNIAFLPFMESCAVYLRDWGSRQKAWQTYREYKEGDHQDKAKLQRALSLYAEADKDIKELAKVWGMEYENVCDLVELSPDGHPTWDGPFCGAFYTSRAQKATSFMGIAFKGTNPFRTREKQVDVDYDLESASYLDGQPVSKGVYGALFGKYPKPIDIAYDHILAHVEIIAKSLPNSGSDTKVRTHVTGHSLGGSYSTFCYAQLVLDVAQGKVPRPNFLKMGDQYTFGAPRVGGNAWAKYYQNIQAHSEGKTWRTVNDNDLVPKVPPSMLKPDLKDFHHVDTGMQIFKDKPPVRLSTEVDGLDPPVQPQKDIKAFINAVLGAKNHGRSSNSDRHCSIRTDQRTHQ